MNTKHLPILSGLCSISFRDRTAGEIVKMVSKAGLAGIEWGGDVHVPHGDLPAAKEVRKMTEDAGLKSSSYGSYFRVGNSASEGLSFESVIETAVMLGTSVIRIWAGTKDAQYVSVEERKKLVKEIIQLSNLSKKENVKIAFEWHGGTLTSTNHSAIDLLDECKSDSVETYWQPPHYESFEYCLDGLKKVHHRVRNVHVFNWYPSASDKKPLLLGEERWLGYLKSWAKPTTLVGGALRSFRIYPRWFGKFILRRSCDFKKLAQTCLGRGLFYYGK